MSTQEIRYRRLLALYPSDFRREYADEMLGVLMSDPRPGRGHVVNLVAGAFAVRFRQTLGGSAWRQAALAAQMFGAILLCSLALRALAMTGMATLRYPSGVVPPVDVIQVIRLVAWGVVVTAAFARLRGLGLAGAIVGLGCEAALPAESYLDTPAVMLHDFWLILTAAVVLLASAVSRGRRPRGWLLVTAGGLSLIVEGLLNPFPEFTFLLYHGQFLGPAGRVGAGFLLASAVLAGAGLFRLEARVRRRVIACAVPVLAAFPLNEGFSGFRVHNQLHPEHLWLISPWQWAVLVAVPALAFWVAARLNARLELSRAAAIAAGAVTDRAVSAGPAKDM
jgi:hypothetical protein